ncbi:MAG TPA: MFS transporter [Pyrinomonadaceae bacterium]|nr:MFS transporter [Pyrinomonadaceae bacterium]
MASPKQVRAESSKQGGTADRSSFTALQYRDFRLLWIGQLISTTGSQMQLVAINWHVYLLTRSSLALGAVGLVRVIPIILCSLLGGVVADAFDRRRLLVITQTTMLLSAGALAAITASRLESVWPIYLLTAISSAAVAFDNPARQALLPMLVPAEIFPNAVSLGLIAFQVSMITGPALAGLILSAFSQQSAQLGPALVYALNALSFLAVIVAVLLMRVSGRAHIGETEASRVSLGALREGLSFVWRTPIIVQTMTLDFVATFFASATALLPIISTEVLHVGARGYGVLAASPAIGSVLAAFAMARLGVVRRQGATVIGAVAVYGAATVAFGLSKVFWFSLLVLAVTGAADTVSTVLRQTIRQLVTPNHLRGRMTSVNMIFFMGGPQLGEMEAGVVAKLIGAPLSVITGGIGCLIAVVMASRMATNLLSYEYDAEQS